MTMSGSDKICLCCGSKFFVIPSQENKRKCCSADCAAKHKSAQHAALYPNVLTAIQTEYITGNLLGDGSLEKPKGNYSQSRFTLKQMSNNTEYVSFIKSILSPFSLELKEIKRRKPSSVNGCINHEISNWGGEYSYSVSFRTVQHPIFLELRNKWYPSGIKSIPQEINLSWVAAAVWFCDDGHNNIDGRYLVLHTDGFTLHDAEFLNYVLQRDLGVSGKIYLRNRHDNNHPIIRLSGDNWFNFIAGVKPFIPWKCFARKCENRESKSLEIVAHSKQVLKEKLDKLKWNLMSDYQSTDIHVVLKCCHGVTFTKTPHSINEKSLCPCDLLPKSGHKYINYLKSGHYLVTAPVNGKRKTIGKFKVLNDAIQARNKYCDPDSLLS
jgi:hypothetical protein